MTGCNIRSVVSRSRQRLYLLLIFGQCVRHRRKAATRMNLLIRRTLGRCCKVLHHEFSRGFQWEFRGLVRESTRAFLLRARWLVWHDNNPPEMTLAPSGSCCQWMHRAGGRADLKRSPSGDSSTAIHRLPVRELNKLRRNLTHRRQARAFKEFWLTGFSAKCQSGFGPSLNQRFKGRLFSAA